MSQPTAQETKIVRRTFFDLDAFEDAYVGKMFTVPQVSSMADALAICNGDHTKLLEVVKTGLTQAARDKAYASADGWYEMNEKNPNEVTDVPFKGTPASPKGVNQMIMTMAKTVFGYVSGRNLAEVVKANNDKAKENAANLIKTTDAIREGLKQAAMAEEY